MTDASDTITQYYVTLRRGGRIAWLLGPYSDHDRAKAAVDAASLRASEIDPKCWFDPHGTTALHLPLGRTFPKGRLNDDLPHLLEGASCAALIGPGERR